MQEFLCYSDREALNFADKFTLFQIGCGTGCVEFSLIDRTTGVVYPGKSFNQDFPRNYHGPMGLKYRRDSKLLVVYQASGYDYPVSVDSYLWDEATLKLLQHDELQAPK